MTAGTFVGLLVLCYIPRVDNTSWHIARPPYIFTERVNRGEEAEEPAYISAYPLPGPIREKTNTKVTQALTLKSRHREQHLQASTGGRGGPRIYKGKSN